MSVKVFQTNSKGKIEFTRAELEKLLNDTYKEGHRDGENKANSNYWTWTSPYISDSTTNVVPLNGTGSITYRNSIGGAAVEGVTLTCDNIVDAAKVAELAGTTSIEGVANNSVTSKPIEVEAKTCSTPKITANVSVNGAKGQVYDLSSLAKEIDQILFGVPTPTGSCGTFAKPKNEHNANLAKELRNV